MVIKGLPNHTEMAIDCMPTGGLYHGDTRIVSVFEYALDKLVLADACGKIIIVEPGIASRSLDGPVVSSHGHDLLLPLPAFDVDRFPLCLKSSGCYVYLVNLRTGWY